nr:NAD-dependent deacylase [candidate division Zixibacteria bacterium]
MEIPRELIQILKKAKRVAVLTGAGISAESGVPTFRGKEGLWAKFRPEELATPEAFMDNPRLVWEWYLFRRNLIKEVDPNPGHYALAEMEKRFEDFTLITQNVDGLHRRAGSKNVLELHGNITRNKCFECGQPFKGDIDLSVKELPRCECGGRIRPDVVWFGELLPPEALNGAIEAASRAELFFSIGTSALVHPAASMPMTARSQGARLVEVNLEPTPLSDLADWAFHGKSGEILPKIVEKLDK